MQKSFDHKSIYLQLGKIRKVGRRSVNNRITANPLFRLVVILAIYETYIKYVSCERNGIIDQMLTNLCANLDSKSPHLEVVTNFCDSWSWKPLSQADRTVREGALAAIDNILGNSISIDELSNLPKKVEDEEFFEYLAANINKCVLELQFNSIKSEKKKVKELTGTLSRLKKDYLANRNEILEAEDTLNSILELELEDKVKNYIKTDVINSEKMTPQFLRMAKSFSNDSLLGWSVEFFLHRTEQGN